MTDRRTAHPYHMHDAIHAQPERTARAIASQRDAIHRAAEAAAARKRLWMVGTGTSLHAAMVADYFLRHFTRGAGAAVIQSFEFVHYPRELRSDDAVIVTSHGGWKGYSAQAVATARAAGALAIAVTGAGGAEHMRGADFVFETCEQEISCAHTKSYTTALAVLALLTIRVAANRGYITTDDAQRAEAAVEKAPELQREALKLESQVAELAPQLAQRLRWRLVGAGPNWATACEGALKVKETSYLGAEGLQIEQFLHGPIAELDERSVLVAHMAGGPGDHRVVAALRGAGEVGTFRVLIASHGATPAEKVAEHVLEAPAASEWLSPLLHVVPLQLLAYYSALACGINPDMCRRDQPAHDRARRHFEL